MEYINTWKILRYICTSLALEDEEQVKWLHSLIYYCFKQHGRGETHKVV